jgi:hypothetical protein
MPSPVRALAAAGLGSFLLAAAALATSERATAPAAVFAVLGALHVAAGVGLAAGSRPLAVLGAVVGLADLALVGAGMAFILGIEAGIGFDLGVRWFAPLNGYATIAAAAVIATVALGLVADGLSAARTGLALPAPHGQGRGAV